MNAPSRVVHCHFPLTVRVIGQPSVSDLDQLAAVVRRMLAGRLADAERALAGASLPGRAPASPPERPRAGSPAADDALVREIYDPDREGFDGYDVPSYDGGGKPVAVPVRRAAVPGYDWRVLRAVYFPTAMRNYLDLMTSLIEAEPGGTGEGAFADRVMYEDIEDDERTITVWLAETERTTTLGEFLDVLTDRAAELLRLPAGQRLLTSASAVDTFRMSLSAIDPSGQVAALPSLARRNARRYQGTGRSAVALHGSWVLFTAVTVPAVGIADIIEAGQRTDVTMGLDAARFCVKPSSFHDTAHLDLDDYVRELAAIQLPVGFLALRVRRETSPERLLYVMRHAFGADALTAAPGQAIFYRTAVADDPDAPDEMRRIGRDFADSLAPLPADKHPRPHTPGRIRAGTVLVFASVQLPVDVETISRVIFAPGARTLATQLRAFLAREPGRYQWDKDVEEWLRTTFELPAVVGRPPGGTLFEYVLAELDTTGDFAKLYEAGLASNDSNVKYRLFELTACTRFAKDPRVQAFNVEQKRHRLFDSFRNHYEPAVPGQTKGSIDLDRKESLRITAGAEGRDVMGDVSSTFIVERKASFMRPEPLARLKAAIEEARFELMADIAAGRTATTYTPDTFAVEVVSRAGVKAKITDDDFYKATIQRSLRILRVIADDREGLPSFTITVQTVDREAGTKAWLPAGDPRDFSAPDFEFNMEMQILGKMGEFYEKVGLVLAIAGVILVAWEVGAITLLIQIGGGAWAVGISISVSLAIYIIKVALGYAEWSTEGFLMAAVEGYLGAVGFKIGSLVAGGIGLSVGMGTVRQVWTGIILQKLTVGVVGGAIGAGLQTFVRDMVEAVAHDRKFSDPWTYVKKMSLGAAMGVVGEFVAAPVMKKMLAKGGEAWSDAVDLVRQLKNEQITFAQFTSEMTTGLRGFRAALDSFLNEASATSLTSAFARRVSEALDAWAEASGGWGQAIVARRVLELSGVKLTPAASRGVATFVRLSESVSSQESARQLAVVLAEQPAEAVTVLEVLSFMPDADVAQLINKTFTDTSSMMSFVAGLARYDAAAQRGALALLAKAGVVEAAHAPAPSAGGDLLARKLESAMRLESRALLAQSQSLRDQAKATFEKGVIAESASRDRATRLLEQAVGLEREAAAREALAADLGRGIDPRAIPQRLPDPHIGDDPAALNAELDRALAELEAGTVPTGPQAWIRIRVPALQDPREIDAFLRRAFRSTSGNPVVLRVEGGDPGERSREFLNITGDGRVHVNTQGRAFNINIGSIDRAVEFLLENRPGARLKIFEIDGDYLENLRGIATPERGTPANLVTTDPATGQVTHLPPAGTIRDIRGVPRTVDVRAAHDQLQIDPDLMPEFKDFIVQGSGRVIEFAPLTPRGKKEP